MKIITKYKDYYDGLQALGQDKANIYIRNEDLKVIDTPSDFKGLEGLIFSNQKARSYIKKKTGLYKEHYYAHKFGLGFCGKVYFGIRVLHVVNNEVENANTFYKADAFRAYERQLLESYYPNKMSLVVNPNINKFSELSTTSNQYGYYFHKLKAPVFVYPAYAYWHTTEYTIHSLEFEYKYKTAFIVNPILKEFQFYKQFDPHTCYQELAQFNGGVLTNNESTDGGLDDLGKVKSHGFDEKYGFRKRPSKK
ncbi:MAG: hypothetical protein ACPGLV_09165 [Bacteroidia bacterium]